MIALLDTNVLVALAWPNHVHHTEAHDFFADQQADGWATCPITQSGFVRVSSNPRILTDARSPQEAILLLEEILRQPGHTFWPDDISITDPTLIARDRLSGHRQVPDAHLLALAIRHKGRLASFDRGLSAILPQGIEPSAVITQLGPSL